MVTRRRLATLVVGATLGGGLALFAQPASAAPTVEVVCHVENVFLRTEPVGPVIDNLPAGSHFAVYETTPGGWAHGTSFFDNTSGYVPLEYLCAE
ncbi:MAG TPA: SH3 domain-containing protein [Amycolatopsis sp.]|jgi:hypothetical protein